MLGVLTLLESYEEVSSLNSVWVRRSVTKILFRIYSRDTKRALASYTCNVLLMLGPVLIIDGYMYVSCVVARSQCCISNCVLYVTCYYILSFSLFLSKLLFLSE
jgi:hypothetical protein